MPDEPATVTPANAPAPAPAPAAPAASPAPGIESLPDWAKTELTRARADAARYRTERNTVRTELQTAQTQLGEFGSTKDQRDALLAEKGTTSLTVMRLEAALEAGLDKDMANRIQGSSAEELLTDAKTLAAKVRTLPIDPTQGRVGDIPLNGDPIEEALRGALGI